MNLIFENKLIAEAKKFGFRPDQRGSDDKFIKSRDQFRGFRMLYTRKYFINLFDRVHKIKEGRIRICINVKNDEGKTFDVLFQGKVKSIKFFRELLLSVGCSPINTSANGA